MAKKFKFSLESLKKHRERLEQEAQRNFQVAAADLSQEVQRLEGFQEAKHQAFLARQKTERVADLTQIQEFILGQDLRIERQQAKIQEFEKRVEDLREILRERMIETRMMKELEAKERQAFRDEMNHREQIQSDDLNIMRHRLRGDEA